MRSLAIFVWVLYNIHSFNIFSESVLNSLFALGNVFGPRKTLENKADIDPALTELTVSWSRQMRT